jgi:hypothetical protein
MKDSIKFAEWLAQEHYRLTNVQGDECWWSNEQGTFTTSILYGIYESECV